MVPKSEQLSQSPKSIQSVKFLKQTSQSGMLTCAKSYILIFKVSLVSLNGTGNCDSNVF